MILVVKLQDSLLFWNCVLETASTLELRNDGQKQCISWKLMSDQCVCPSTISIVFGGLKAGEKGELHETTASE